MCFVLIFFFLPPKGFKITNLGSYSAVTSPSDKIYHGEVITILSLAAYRSSSPIYSFTCTENLKTFIPLGLLSVSGVP